MRSPASPTVDLLVAFAAVFALQAAGRVVGLGPAWFALAAPAARPWTLVTGVYAHAGLGHLVGNAVALAVVGFPLERVTTRARFHDAYVLVTGATAGVAELIVGELAARSPAVLGPAAPSWRCTGTRSPGIP